MKKLPLDIARGVAARLSGQIRAGVQRGRLIGDRNVYFTDDEVDEMDKAATDLVKYLEGAGSESGRNRDESEPAGAALETRG